MTKKHQLTEEEKAEFRKAMKEFKPFADIDSTSQKSADYKKSSLSESDIQSIPFEAISGETILKFHRTGLQHNVLRKLRQGKIAFADTLDLHGLTIQQSQQAMIDFLDHAVARHYRCVLMIHGKGRSTKSQTATIKSFLYAWLPRHNNVMAFYSAQPKDGGTGALYVLIRS